MRSTARGPRPHERDSNLTYLSTRSFLKDSSSSAIGQPVPAPNGRHALQPCGNGRRAGAVGLVCPRDMPVRLVNWSWKMAAASRQEPRYGRGGASGTGKAP